MKGIAVSALLSVFAATAFAGTPGEDYVAALNKEVSACNMISLRSHLDEQLEQTRSGYASSTTITANGQKLADCAAKAREKGKDIYKAFAASDASPALKVSAKNVFIAWLSYLPVAMFYDAPDNSPEVAEYNKAVATFNVDEMSQ